MYLLFPLLVTFFPNMNDWFLFIGVCLNVTSSDRISSSNQFGLNTFTEPFLGVSDCGRCSENSWVRYCFRCEWLWETHHPFFSKGKLAGMVERMWQHRAGFKSCLYHSPPAMLFWVNCITFELPIFSSKRLVSILKMDI